MRVLKMDVMSLRANADLFDGCGEYDVFHILKGPLNDGTRDTRTNFYYLPKPTAEE